MRPQPGDAVRIRGVWRWGLVDPGKLGIIGGEVDGASQYTSITWHSSNFRGYDSYGRPECDLLPWKRTDFRVFVSCSGGPATIATPFALLIPTPDRADVRFWCWRGLPKAYGGIDYWLNVPVWEIEGEDL